jgi:hypothetical protein
MHENDKKRIVAVDNSVAGLNDNIEFLGRQLHIQTERIGFPSPRIVTQVFSNGRVMFSKKADISFRTDEPQATRKVQELMQIQHFQVIREIKAKQSRILDKSVTP